MWSILFAKAWLRWACIYFSSMWLPQAILHWRVLGLEGMCRPHNLNFSSYWWEKMWWSELLGFNPNFLPSIKCTFAIVWSEALSFIGSSILIFWEMERKKSKQLRLCLSSGLLFGGRLSRHLTSCRRLSISQARQLGRWPKQMAPHTLFPRSAKGNLNLHSCTVRRSCPCLLCIVSIQACAFIYSWSIHNILSTCCVAGIVLGPSARTIVAKGRIE